MTEMSPGRPNLGGHLVKVKPQVEFATWLEETLYCRMPVRPMGRHEGDLVIQVAYCQTARSQGLNEDLVRKAIQTLLDRKLLERYGHKGERYLRKAKGERALSLQFI